MEHNAIVDEFTHQAEAFNASPVMSSADTLGRLIESLPAGPDDSWLDAACGPGLVARALAPRIRAVVGVDLTPAMIEVAARETEAEGIANASFRVGDATALDFADSTFDGAVTRFSLHHVPVPGRVVSELRRVVRPGGFVVVADHLTADDAGGAAWHQEIERLRDPSHWACLTRSGIAALGEAAGLELVRQEQYPFELDYTEWLQRGSGGPGAAGLIAQSLRDRPAHPAEFGVDRAQERLRLLLSIAVWRRPD